eukprot:TRINITY_DN2075_c0_g1_i1.p1 TRINITY_DN2075_c0_g1~~TRINITY_DN2075_c0_g1_i1.p1  ORF type:complete len:116 (-),score=34.53 TRINITY_DN2075_c0_g1_i1:367-714(-)
MAAVEQRMNFKLFQQAASGTAVRIGGRFSAPSGDQPWVLTTTDGGSLTVTPQSGLQFDDSNSFVEVTGTKGADGKLEATGLSTLSGEVDVELWESHVNLLQTPQLRWMFAPAGAA